MFLTASDPKTWKCLLFLTNRNESETLNLQKVYAKLLVFWLSDSSDSAYILLIKESDSQKVRNLRNPRYFAISIVVRRSRRAFQFGNAKPLRYIARLSYWRPEISLEGEIRASAAPRIFEYTEKTLPCLIQTGEGFSVRLIQAQFVDASRRFWLFLIRQSGSVCYFWQRKRRHKS